MVEFKKALQLDLATFEARGGRITYPFPIEDYATKVFGLDIQYENFDLLLKKDGYEPGDFFGMLFPTKDPMFGLEKVIYINTNRKPFKLGDFEVPKEYYIEDADRQTIAHEVGHYSDKYAHNMTGQNSLFPEVFVDDPTSVVVYPKEAEVFANKYARHLLVPDKELIRLINKHDLHGTIDLRDMAKIFTRHFGVTQFMIEIRLNEMKIHFNNGVYIKKLNHTRGKDYSENELRVLLELARRYNFEVSYYDADSFVGLFNKLTGGTRASGPLYMAFNRLMDGEYDAKYPEIFDKRIRMLIEDQQAAEEENTTVRFPRKAN